MITLWLLTGVLAQPETVEPVLRGGGYIEDYPEQRRKRIEAQNAVVLAVVNEFLRIEK